MLAKCRNTVLKWFALVSFGLLAAFAFADDLLVVDYEHQDPTNPAKSFKMQIPANWTVKENFGGYAVFLEPKDKAVATAESPIAADPNISIAVINDPKPIDEDMLRDYAVEIEKKFAATNGGSNEFNIFAKHLLTDLPGGKRALMYYLTYINNGVDVGSTILVMSNGTHMYRVTYTDYRVNYEKNFEKFFPVMSSLQIMGSPPERENFLKPVMPYLIGIAVFAVAMFFLRRKRERNMQDLYDQADSGAFDGEPTSRAPKFGVENMKSKGKSKAPQSAKGQAFPESFAPGSTPPGSVPAQSKAPGSIPPKSSTPNSTPPHSSPSISTPPNSTPPPSSASPAASSPPQSQPSSSNTIGSMPPNWSPPTSAAPGTIPPFSGAPNSAPPPKSGTPNSAPPNSNSPNSQSPSSNPPNSDAPKSKAGKKNNGFPDLDD